MNSFAKGIATGLGLSLLCIVATASLILPRAVRAATAGWNLVPVALAATDIPAGTVLESSHLAQRDLPEQFITAAQISPSDVALILSRPTPQALAQGEPLVYSSFVDALPRDAVECE